MTLREPIFGSVTDGTLKRLAKSATESFILLAPGVSEGLAKEIANLAHSGIAISVSLDCNDEPIRLGYGTLEGIRTLLNAAIPIGQCPGLRTGVVIADQQGYSFSPVPLLVASESRSAETPNAFILSSDQIRELTLSLAPTLLVRNGSENQASLDLLTSQEIGTVLLTVNEVMDVQKSLTERPPVPPDLQRQVRVFQPYIQYVELKLTGAYLNRQKVAIPDELLGIITQEDLKNRLKTTFNLFEDSKAINIDGIQTKVEDLRKLYLRRIKALHGSVILTGKRTEFESELSKIRVEIEEYQSRQTEIVSDSIKQSIEKLITYYLPIIRQSPPQALTAQLFSGTVPSDEEITRWLGSKLRKAFPAAEKVISNIELECTYKDVTYQSLKREGLLDQLKEAFETIDWDTPMKEFTAIPERANEIQEDLEGGLK